MPVHVRTSGGWAETDDVFIKRGPEWLRVRAAYVYAEDPPGSGLYGWIAAFDQFQEAPSNVRGINPTHSSGTLTWDVAPRATRYQVLVRIKGSPAVLPLLPDDGWTSELHVDLTGLAQDTEYSCTVKAARDSGDLAEDIISVESKAAVLSTGHPATVVQNPEYPGTQLVYVSASKTDTWSSDRGWGQSAGDVVQGYATYAVRNGYGGVAYTTAYTQLSKLPGGTRTADVIEVVDAKIDYVYRKAGGASTPQVDVYAWKYTTGDPRGTDVPSVKSSFRAPAEGKSLDELDFATLLTMAKVWVKKAPAYSGLLLWRTGGSGNTTSGYNGYTIFRACAASGGPSSADWRLKLYVRWRYDYPALLSAKWTPGG